MTASTKMSSLVLVASLILLVTTFSTPLHLPTVAFWVLQTIAILMYVAFFVLRRRVARTASASASTDREVAVALDTRRAAIRRNLAIGWVTALVVALLAPLWLPFAGSQLPMKGNFATGLVVAFIVSAIFSLRLRSLKTR
jgi:hypothetical protein